jgi:hypothetical protein
MLHSQMVMAQSIDEAVCNVNTEMNLGLCMKQLDKSHGCTLQSHFGVQDQLVACAAHLGRSLGTYFSWPWFFGAQQAQWHKLALCQKRICVRQCVRQARSWYQGPNTWVGTRAPTPNILVPSAPRCLGLDILYVMASEEAARAWDYSCMWIPRHACGCRGSMAQHG